MLTGNEIPAGGEGKIAVSARSSQQRRQLRQTARVQTNDPVNPAIELVITATVQINLEIEPPILRLEGTARSQTASVTLKNHTAQPVQLSAIQASVSSVDLAVSATTIPAHGEVTVQAKVLPDAPSGILSGWLTMQTDLPTFPTLQIRLWGNIP